MARADAPPRARSSSTEARILVVDDNPRIHEDYERLLERCGAATEGRVTELERMLFGTEPQQSAPTYEVDHCHQGQEAIEAVRASLADSRPYAVVFTDVRMPPGISGIRAAAEIRALDPAVQLVIVTAKSDYTWSETLAQVGRSEGLHLLRKPFTATQVRQYASVLARKWELRGRVEARAG